MSEPATPPRHVARLRALAAICGLGVVSVASWFFHGRQPRIASAAVPLDTPRVEGTSILYSRAFAKRAGLHSVAAVEAPLGPVVSAVGTLDFDPAYVAVVGARLHGFVKRVGKFEGDRVEPGALLAVIESPELGETQAAALSLAAEKRAADSNLTREQALVAQRLSTPREAELAAVEAKRYENLLSSARGKVAALGATVPRSTGALGRQELRAPLKGTIVERNVAPGQPVEPDLVTFRIADPDHLWVELDVYEKNLVRVRAGDPVELTPLANRKNQLQGRVARVSPLIDGTTRSATVRVEIPNHAGKLRAGQAVSARIRTSAPREGNVTVVPTSSITFFDGKPTIFVEVAEGTVHVVPVETGVTNGPETEIRRGIEPGDHVVSDGVFALKSELFR